MKNLDALVYARIGKTQQKDIRLQSARHGMKRSALIRYAIQLGLDQLRKTKPLKNQIVIIP